MDAVVWSDYLCPWCYLGRDRTKLLGELGVNVVPQPFEVHPEYPPSGRRVIVDGKVPSVYRRIAEECESIGMPFRPPTLAPNTRRALETAEVVRASYPDYFSPLHNALFDAVFVDNLDIGDPDVLDTVVSAVGLPAAHVSDEVDAGRGNKAVDESKARAYDAGVTGAPSWLLAGVVLIPGVQTREHLEHWVSRVRDRLAAGLLRTD